MTPSKWQESILGQHISLHSGQHVMANAVNDIGKGVPYLTGPSDFSEDTINHSKYVEKPKTTCIQGDLLLTVKGSGIGTTVVADASYCISRQLMALRAKNINQNFLYYVATDALSEIVHQAAIGMIPGISRNDILKLKILLPPLLEQEKIAEILKNHCQLIKQLTIKIGIKRQHKRALMQRLLTGKLRFPEFADQPWPKLSADKIFKSHSKKGNANAPLLAVMQDVGVVPRDSLDRKVAMPQGDTHSYKLVESGDFVISLRSFQGGLEYSRHRGIVSPAYTVLKSVCPIVDDFYKHYFKSYDFIGHLAVAVIGIRDGKQISYDDFSLLKLPYPGLDEQRKIAAVLSAADREIDQLTQKFDAYKQQKKGLMQQLLTGKKRVKLDHKEAA